MTLDPVNLGRYRVLGELGRGAMGVVYLAEDPSLKRSVAVKVVTAPAVNREEALGRFQREAETAARLHHPNIVSVFDVGEEPGVGPYLAMEWVEGVSLQEYLQGRMVPRGEALDLISQAVAAVAAAHGMGILHRDIKPGNFMRSRQGVLKLMDFGLALGHQPTTTALLCTPAYAAPELLRGLPPTPATDLWALAVTAWQVLAGRLPFDGPSIAAVLSAVGQDPPSLEGTDLPEAALEVFRRALAKDPVHRQPTAQAFLGDLLDAFPETREAQGRVTERLVPATAPSPAPTWQRRALPWAGIGVLSAGLLWAWLAGVLGTRRLTVLSTPRGAVALLDGRILGETPLVDVAIPPFARELRLEREGFRPLTRPLLPAERRLDLRMEPAPTVVDLASDPPGAEVWLGGERKGITPLRGLEIPPQGRHELQIRLKGYETWSLTVSSNQRPPARVVLQKADGTKPARKKGLVDRVKGWFR